MANYPNLSNVDDVQSGLLHLKNITDGLFYFFIPLSISAVIIIVGVISGKRLSYTCLVSMIIFGLLSGILSFMNLLSGYYAILGFVFAGLCAIWVKFDTP